MKLKQFEKDGLVHHSVIGDFTAPEALELFESGTLPRPNLVTFSPPYPGRGWTSTFTEDGKELTLRGFDELMLGILGAAEKIILPAGFIVINFDDWWVTTEKITRVISYHETFDRFLRDMGFVCCAKLLWEKGVLRNMMKILKGINHDIPRIGQRQLNNVEHIWAYQRECREDIPEVDDEFITWESKVANPHDEWSLLHREVIWRVETPAAPSRVGHPCEQPVELVRRIIKRWSYPGDVVLDPCCGSGTVLEAASLLSRTGIGFEINPVYAAAQRARMM